MSQPTLEPKGERILADIETTLQAISQNDATQTYWYNIPHRNVHRVNTGYPVLQVYPALVIEATTLDTDDERSAAQFNKNTEQLRVQINCHVNERSNVQRAMQRILRDVRVALMQDPTRGGDAQHTFAEGADFFPQAEAQSNAKSVVQAYFRVEYYTRATDLETTPA